MKKLRADEIQGKPVTSQYKIFFLPFHRFGIYRFIVAELYFCLLCYGGLP